MRKIDKPKDIPEDVFEECLTIIKNANLKKRLSDCKSLIRDASKEFESKVTKGSLHTINRELLVNGNVTSKELEDVYTLRMAKKNTPGRELYDRIKLSAPFGICPLCSQRLATTLDHYLPKSKYPRLSVVPINLIPACKDCNISKLTAYPCTPEEETIHPYFDDIENDVWLKALVNRTTPPSIKFYVDPPTHWSDLLSKRVGFHFDSLSLNELYSVHAASELRQINFRIDKLFILSGGAGVKEYLLEAAQTRSHDNANSWQSALYNAASADNWFCNGGFKF